MFYYARTFRASSSTVPTTLSHAGICETPLARTSEFPACPAAARPLRHSPAVRLVPVRDERHALVDGRSGARNQLSERRLLGYVAAFDAVVVRDAVAPEPNLRGEERQDRTASRDVGVGGDVPVARERAQTRRGELTAAPPP